MEVFSGLRSRNKESQRDVPTQDNDPQCKKQTFPEKIWALFSQPLTVRKQNGSQIFVLVCLCIVTFLSWKYLTKNQVPGPDYHHMMGERIRQKMEASEHLDEEDHDWIRSMGMSVHQVHHEHKESYLPPGDSLHIAIMVPFLDQYPLSAPHYLKMLEWITMYSSVKLHFHVISNEESKEYIDQIMDKVNTSSNCHFDYEMLYFDEMIDFTRDHLCPDVAKSEEYCNLLIGRVTPLLFPWLFPSLTYILYVDKHIVFHDDVGKLYGEFLKMDEEESIGMVQEQTVKYLRAFGSYHLKSPSTKLGRPPRKGNPGFNPDLMVMDLVKLRADSAYKSLIHELKISLLLKKYSMHLDDELPDLGEILNLIAAEKPAMFHKLSCEWNKSASTGYDPLSAEFLDCLPEDKKSHRAGTTTIKATNNNPNHRK